MAVNTDHTDSFADETISQLNKHETATSEANAYPNYWLSNPRSLLISSDISRVSFGNGLSIFEESIIPRILAAEREVILVTCFWARSETLNALNNALRQLSSKAFARENTIKVRICFSSSSFLQKLFHTRSLRGKNYPPSKWVTSLGLPDPAELQGLDIRVKSIFVLPFSVMHPKFVIVDREVVLLPSCNVSWESWFEGCIELQGPVIEQFTTFWQQFWKDDDHLDSPNETLPPTRDNDQHSPEASPNNTLSSTTFTSNNISSIFLPSPHHANPHFRPSPWSPFHPAPPTPLNIYLLALFAKARTKIYIQTPNLTSSPVLHALLSALQRGVSIKIVTSENLMTLEQLVTAGTTTKRCVKWLVREYERHLQHLQASRSRDLEASAGAKIGALEIHFYRPLPSSDPERKNDRYEPVQSHLKLTAVDDRVLVFGSGNLDRASWSTSQELGLGLVSSKLSRVVIGALEEAMEGRSWCFYESEAGR